MLEEKIEILYNTIIERTKKWGEYCSMFGKDDILTEGVFNSIIGLEEAFQLLAGRSYTSVMLERTSAILEKCELQLTALNA